MDNMRATNASYRTNGPDKESARDREARYGPAASTRACAVHRRAREPCQGSAERGAFRGEGATREGAFHEAMNFAAVFHTPVIFFVQNNQYAISVPLARQTVAPSLAHKAVGYGIPGVGVDGNDVAAVLSVISHA